MTTSGHSYDANGNETTVNGQTATYDFENHLLTVGSANSYTYDADGNRLSATTSTATTSYLVDTAAPFARVLEEYSGASLSARYDYGDDLLRMDRSLPSTSTSYYLYDGLGSTRQLVDATGVVKEGYLYDAYGLLLQHSPSSGIVNPFLFQGQQFDTATNDYYQRARYYDPNIGRFLSQDLSDGDPSDPISLHRYLYASSDPQDNIDPGGNEDFSLGQVVAATAISSGLGAIAGYAIVDALGGSAEDKVQGAIALGSASGALALGYTTGKGPETLISGFLGGLISFALTELIHDPGQEVSPLSAYLSFIRGFASSAVTTATALPINDPKQKFFLSAFVTTIGDFSQFIRKDYNKDDYSDLPSQLGYTLVDATISGLFAYGKKSLEVYTTKGVTPDKAETYFKGISNDRFHKIVLDLITKELQFPTKGGLKVIFGNFDPGVN